MTWRKGLRVGGRARVMNRTITVTIAALFEANPDVRGSVPTAVVVEDDDLGLRRTEPLDNLEALS